MMEPLQFPPTSQQHQQYAGTSSSRQNILTCQHQTLHVGYTVPLQLQLLHPIMKSSFPRAWLPSLFGLIIRSALRHFWKWKRVSLSLSPPLQRWEDVEVIGTCSWMEMKLQFGYLPQILRSCRVSPKWKYVKSKFAAVEKLWQEENPPQICSWDVFLWYEEKIWDLKYSFNQNDPTF